MIRNIEEFREKYADKTSEQNISVVSRVCSVCKNFDDSNPAARKCLAFPEGIPLTIWFGENNHTKPYKGDNGIQFEQIDFKQVA